MADKPSRGPAGTAAPSNAATIPVDDGHGADQPASSISANGKGPLSRYLEAQPQRGSASDAVTNALREAILDGTIAESTWLREEDLARELSVSRTPVREALRRLADERLTNRVANRGSIVAPMTLDEVLAVYVVRESLEGLAARTVAQRRPAGAVEMLYDMHNQMIEHAARRDVEQLAALNLEFHGILRRQAANPYLDLFLTQVEQAVRRFRHSTLDKPERCEKALAEHLRIIEAIAAGDADGAQEAALVHMRNARQARIIALTEM
jgi:DNA-binding GntR family transcriptional regulator